MWFLRPQCGSGGSIYTGRRACFLYTQIRPSYLLYEDFTQTLPFAKCNSLQDHSPLHTRLPLYQSYPPLVVRPLSPLRTHYLCSNRTLLTDPYDHIDQHRHQALVSLEMRSPTAGALPVSKYSDTTGGKPGLSVESEAKPKNKVDSLKGSMPKGLKSLRDVLREEEGSSCTTEGHRCEVKARRSSYSTASHAHSKF